MNHQQLTDNERNLETLPSPGGFLVATKIVEKRVDLVETTFNFTSVTETTLRSRHCRWSLCCALLRETSRQVLPMVVGLKLGKTPQLSKPSLHREGFLLPNCRILWYLPAT